MGISLRIQSKSGWLPIHFAMINETVAAPLVISLMEIYPQAIDVKVREEVTRISLDGSPPSTIVRVWSPLTRGPELQVRSSDHDHIAITILIMMNM